MALLAGVDIGTQGTKAALYTEDGAFVALAYERSDIRRPSAGAVEEDAERQVGSVVRTIRACVEQLESEGAAATSGATELAAIAIDGQMAGIIGIDASGRAITPYDSWLDTRCAPQIAEMSATAEDAIVSRVGCAPSFNHGPKILWWRDEHPELFARIASFVQPGGYAAMRLCGLTASEAFIDYTYLHFSGFSNTSEALWDAELCRTFSLPAEKLPRIVASHEIVGRLAAGVAAEMGVRAGVPVVAGCGDTAASFLSCGATRAGVCVDVAGTASVFAATTDAFRPDATHRALACGRSAVPGLWHPYAYINGGGENLEWFRREIGADEPIAELDARAAAITDPATVPLFVPHLAGRVSPPMPALRGAWVGLDWSHTSAHLYRAVLEGVALEYGLYRDVLVELYPELTLREVRVTGGGEASALWNRIKATILGTPVVKIEGAGGAPRGSAMLAGFGAGLFSSLDEAAERWVRVTPGAEPEAALDDHYRTRVDRYRELLRHLDEFHRSGAS
ncbi:MAG: xylulokinase [Spirochaetota bacterium]